MTKTYTTPRLAHQGEVIERTNTFQEGVGDPLGLEARTPGSIGFCL